MKKSICSILITISVLLIWCLPVYASSEELFVEYLPQYSYMHSIDDGITVCNIPNTKNHVVIDAHNKVVKSIENGDIVYSNGKYAIIKDQVVTVYNSQFETLFSVAGIGVGSMSSAYISIKNEDLKQTLYSMSGTLLLSQPHDDILVGDGEVIIINDNGIAYNYNLTTGSSTVNNIISYQLVNNQYIICQTTNGYGVIDFHGNLKIPFGFDNIKYDELGYYKCYRDTGVNFYNDIFNFVGGFDISGYSVIGDISENKTIATLTSYGKPRYVNINGGQTVMDTFNCDFEVKEVRAYYEGYASVKGTNESSYIDMNGTQATEKTWTETYRFAGDYALTMDRIFSDEDQTYVNQWYIINKDFEVVKTLDCDVYIDPKYPASTNFSDGYIRTIDTNTGLMGFIRLDSLNVQGYLLGDINRDGYVDIDDSLLLFQNSLYPDYYPISYPGTLDFTKDGYVDIDDSLLLFQYSLYPDYYPIG